MAKPAKKVKNKSAKVSRPAVVKKAAKPAPKKIVKKTKPIAAKKVAKAPAKPVNKAQAPKKAITKKVSKPVAKKVSKPIAKKQVAPAKEKIANVVVVKEPIKVAVPTVPNPLKAAPSALNIFPNVTQQRPIAHQPATKPTPSNKDNRTRYSEEELKEFEALINEKLDKAKLEYKILKDTLNRNNDEGTDATSGGNTKVLEDGAETAEKENMSQLAARQQKYVMNLENALVRIKNGTYGICSVTGKLISKERLYAVPHTTQSIEAKMKQSD